MLNLLDGLRDLKAPLASGTVTLFALWLAFANGIAAVEPGNSLVGNVRRLIEYLGVPATLGMVAFIAYLLGLVLPMHKALRYFFDSREHVPGLSLTRGTSTRFRRYVWGLVEDVVDRGVDVRDIYEAIGIKDKDPGGFKVPIGQDASADRDSEPITDSEPLTISVSREAFSALGRDMNLLAVQLQTAKEKMYEQYDKAKTEADFRAALVPPLFLVALVAGGRFWLEGLGWLLPVIVLGAAPVLAGLIRASTSRLQDAHQILATAVILGYIELPVLAAIKNLGTPMKKRGLWPFRQR